MNVYVATRNNMVGVVLTGTHNKIYFYKAFETQTTDKEAQTVLATQRAVSFAIGNKVLYAGNSINVYTEDDVSLDKFNNEYFNRLNYPIEIKQATTDEEKKLMVFANSEITSELRRIYIGYNGR